MGRVFNDEDSWIHNNFEDTLATAATYGSEWPLESSLTSCLTKPTGEMNCLNHCVVEGEDSMEEQIIGSVVDTSVDIAPVIDSGAVDNVVHPQYMPKDAEIEANRTNHHYSNASGGVIIRHGHAYTILTDENGQHMICPTQVADVVRPLHSVSKVTGGPEPVALAGMVFTNNVGCVVAAGALISSLPSSNPMD